MYQINDKGNWIDLKEKIRLAYPTITEADLTVKDGEEFDLLNKLQKKFSKSKDEVVEMIDKL